MNNQSVILGAGMTGLAAGCASGLPVYEATDTPGGICSSYYFRPGENRKLTESPEDGEAYRFEIGGGHWIFGGDPTLLDFLKKLVPLSHFQRKSSVYFSNSELFVPYPIQNHLRYLDKATASQAIDEMAQNINQGRTMKDWLVENFGPSLCKIFFYPFHQLYTAGLYDKIAPQDAYKSPVDLKKVIEGASTKTVPVGYNTDFVYPTNGLNNLAKELADRCNLHYRNRITRIDTKNNKLYFENNSTVSYEKIISTLPLNKMSAMTGIATEVDPDPYSSVLVLNIGATRGDRCPDDHWIYVPRSSSGFHRVGFYSNVDVSFLPSSARKKNNKVSIYVERAYEGGLEPSISEIEEYKLQTFKELQDWGFIGDVAVIDSTWIDVAYTWSWPNSNWKQFSIDKLAKYNIHQVGRYGVWAFQGIADSIRDGLKIGAALK